MDQRDDTTYTSLLIYHVIRQYSNLFRISFPKFCKPEVFAYTLDRLNPNHLYFREKSISIENII